MIEKLRKYGRECIFLGAVGAFSLVQGLFMSGTLDRLFSEKEGKSSYVMLAPEDRIPDSYYIHRNLRNALGEERLKTLSPDHLWRIRRMFTAEGESTLGDCLYTSYTAPERKICLMNNEERQRVEQMSLDKLNKRAMGKCNLNFPFLKRENLQLEDKLLLYEVNRIYPY